MINYAAIKNDLAGWPSKIGEEPASYPSVGMRDILLLRVLHSIAADLDTLAFCARENLKKSPCKTKKR